MNAELDGYEVWRRAADVVGREFIALPGLFLEKIEILVAEIKSLKTALFELTRIVEGEAVCKACNGGCCDSGRYHFTVTDLLAYLSDGKELFVPDFSNGRCPYLGRDGCMMEPEYRPFNCISFNCECLEELLPQEDVRTFYEMEKELRMRYTAVENLFGKIFAYGLMSNYERVFAISGGILFNSKHNTTHTGGSNGNCLQRPGPGRH
jgi:hypothetical protein